MRAVTGDALDGSVSWSGRGDALRCPRFRREGLEAEEVADPHSRSWYVTDPTGYEIEVAHWNGDRIVFDAATKEEAR